MSIPQAAIDAAKDSERINANNRAKEARKAKSAAWAAKEDARKLKDTATEAYKEAEATYQAAIVTAKEAEADAWDAARIK